MGVGLSLTVLTLIIAWFVLNTNKPCANSRTCHQPLAEQIDNSSLGTFLGHTVIPPQIVSTRSAPSVLGETSSKSGASKHIYIDLDQQTLHAYQDSNEVMTALVSTGRWGWTPVGNYAIQSKFRATRMAGGSGNDYYNLPNVPYTMFFYGDFGIHGAYWHNNFGSPMSHGCVNMRIVDAQALFEWADGPYKGDKGTPVSVCQSFTAPDNCVQDKKTHLPTPSALPAAFADEALERISPDGSQTVSLDVENHVNGTKTYKISVLDVVSGTAQLINSVQLPEDLHLNLPYNTWSPDNKYFFVEKKTRDSAVSNVLVFRATETSPTEGQLLEVADTFSQKQPNYTFERVTGWASESLLIVNSLKPDGSKGPSFWYEIPSQALIPLSQQF